MESLYKFFDGVSYSELVLWLVTAAIFLNKGLGVKLINWLKNKLGLSDDAAHYFVIGLLLCISLLAMFVTGQFADISWDFKTLMSQFGVAMVPAGIAYRRLKIGDVPGIKTDPAEGGHDAYS
jgi:hypothetical protein